MIAAESILSSLAFDAFFAANQVATGGVTGLAQAVHVFPPGISVGARSFALDVPLFAGRKVMDTVLYGMNASKAAYVIPDSWREIAEVLLWEQERGTAILRGEGSCTGGTKFEKGKGEESYEL